MNQTLKDTLKSINKNHGAGSVQTGQSKAKVEVIPTGSLALDMALGVGGYPKGRIIEIYGLESCGKSTLALHATANVQKNKGTVAYIDTETCS